MPKQTSPEHQSRQHQCAGNHGTRFVPQRAAGVHISQQHAYATPCHHNHRHHNHAREIYRCASVACWVAICFSSLEASLQAHSQLDLSAAVRHLFLRFRTLAFPSLSTSRLLAHHSAFSLLVFMSTCNMVQSQQSAPTPRANRALDLPVPPYTASGNIVAAGGSCAPCSNL